MNHSKIILVGFISAFVAITTAVLGVAGTIIGSVLSSVLYNVLSEALEKPVEKATFSADFEWEIAYVFPLVVIAIIQLLLIFALLSEWGLMSHTFLNVYLSIQGVADNNLYRVLGLALIVMSVYPFVLKPDFIKQSHGVVIAFVGLIFLARGFVDSGFGVTNLYAPFFEFFDFPIALIAFLLLLSVIIKILISAKKSEQEFNITKKELNKKTHSTINVSGQFHSKKHQNFKRAPNNNFDYSSKRKNNNHIKKSENKINESAGDIQFESNDLLDDYKK